jgi:hypothetical protein
MEGVPGAPGTVETGELGVDGDSMGHPGNWGGSRYKWRSPGCAGRDTGKLCSDRMDAGGRHSIGSYSGARSGGLLPRPSPPRAGSSGDGVLRGVNPSRAFAGRAILRFVLGSAEALEVLATQGSAQHLGMARGQVQEGELVGDGIQERYEHSNGQEHCILKTHQDTQE